MKKNKKRTTTAEPADSDDAASKAKASRLSVVESDPLFHEMPRHNKKVKVDPRFKAMFDDERFAATSASVDRHGRPINKLRERENLRNLYDVEKSDSGGSDDEDKLHERKPALNRRLDLARGEGNVSSSSDEEENEADDADSDADDAVDFRDKLGIHEKWGELDRDVKRVDWVSRRLAICNMDWDKISAEDVFMALDSLKPNEGSIKSVSVYLSDFGAEQIKYEEEHGPRLPVVDEKPAKEPEGSDDNDDEEEDGARPEIIRAYQFNRFRYYYAVAECDTEETANNIYENCDGIQYQSTGLTLDLRFIPDDMEFDEIRLRDQCLPTTINSKKYRSNNFQSAATRSNVKLEWETEDFHRKKKVQKAFEEDANLDDLGQLVAPGSDSEDEKTREEAAKLLLSTANVSVFSKKAAKPGEEDDDSNAGGEEEPVEQKPKKAKKSKKSKLTEKLRTKRKLKLAQLANQLPANVDDERFAALYTSSEFAIDKTNPNYKGGVLADRQVHEKVRRKKTE